MKKILMILIIVAFGSLAKAQIGPKIVFDADELTIDYGTVSKGDNGVRSFEFVNKGDAPLFINFAESTARSVVITKPSAAILPGKRGKIDIKYNMSPGPIRKTITVETNAVNYPEGRIALKIKGEVR